MEPCITFFNFNVQIVNILCIYLYSTFIENNFEKYLANLKADNQVYLYKYSFDNDGIIIYSVLFGIYL